MSTPPPPKGGKGVPGKPGGPLGALHGKPGAAIALGGAAVVVVVALVRKSSAGSASTSTDTTGTGTSGTPTYDSTSNDVYNSLESQLEQFQLQLSQMQNGLPSGTGSTSSGGASTPGGGTTTSPVFWPTPGAPVGSQSTANSAPGGAASHLGVRPIKSGSPFSTVTVSGGQTLGGIAKAHGESLQTLLADNPVYTRNAKYRGGNRIWAGDKVKVR